MLTTDTMVDAPMRQKERANKELQPRWMETGEDTMSYNQDGWKQAGY